MAKLSDNNLALKSKMVAADLGGKGSTGSPAYLVLYDLAGVAWYFFPTIAGQLRFHNAIPTVDTDGTAV